MSLGLKILQIVVALETLAAYFLCSDNIVTEWVTQKSGLPWREVFVLQFEVSIVIGIILLSIKSLSKKINSWRLRRTCALETPVSNVDDFLCRVDRVFQSVELHNGQVGLWQSFGLWWWFSAMCALIPYVQPIQGIQENGEVKRTPNVLYTKEFKWTISIPEDFISVRLSPS